MALASNSKSLYSSSGSTPWTLSISFDKNSQDTANNTTSVTITGKIKSSSGSFSSSSNTLYIDWYDNNTGSWSNKGSKSVSSISAGGSSTVTATFNVTHKNDGTLSGKARARWSHGGNNTWAPNSGSTETSSTALPSIPRASVPTMGANSYKVNAPITIKTNSKVSSYTHWIWLEALVNNVGYSHRLVNYTDGITTSYKWTPGENAVTELMSASPNGTSFPATIRVRTFNDSTRIGAEESVSFTYTIPDTYKPVISGWTISEQNADISSLLDDAGTVVRILSNKLITFTVVARNSATLSKVTIKNGTTTKTLSIGTPTISYVTIGGEQVVKDRTYSFTTSFNNLTNSGFTISAKDSRGFTSSATFNSDKTLIEYNKPALTSIFIYRTDSQGNPDTTGNLANLVIKGIWFNGVIGNVANALTLKYNFDNAQSDTTVIPDTSGSGIVEFSKTITGIQNAEYNQEYSCVVKVSDSFDGTEISQTIKLASADPVIWFGSNTVRVNKNLIIEGNDSTLSMGSDGPTNLATMTKAYFASLIKPIEETVNFSSSFTNYTTDTNPHFYKFGKIVLCTGKAKPTAEITGGTTRVIMFTAPDGFKPANDVLQLCNGSGARVWLLEGMSASGNFTFSRMRTGDTWFNAPTSEWLPFSITYITND